LVYLLHRTCCDGTSSTYNIRVSRSMSVNGRIQVHHLFTVHPCTSFRLLHVSASFICEYFAHAEPSKLQHSWVSNREFL
jgi:hypothetical protein